MVPVVLSRPINPHVPELQSRRGSGHHIIYGNAIPRGPVNGNTSMATSNRVRVRIRII